VIPGGSLRRRDSPFLLSCWPSLKSTAQSWTYLAFRMGHRLLPITETKKTLLDLFGIQNRTLVLFGV
jgi:hypothetical protein